MYKIATSAPLSLQWNHSKKSSKWRIVILIVYRICMS